MTTVMKLPPLGQTPAEYKKESPPKLGPAFGDRYGDPFPSGRYPGAGILQFNLDKLTLSDFRQMKDHYQINASLSVLTFMMHQTDWKIVSDNAKVAKRCEDNLRKIWTRMVRALSQAFWAGYSPCVLEWENNTGDRWVELTKVKDLIPERAEVWWEEVEGWAPPGHMKPKFKQYGGIRLPGQSWPVPPENTLWYPLLKENENWYGKKLLRPAFTSWYFSVLIHLFANHYMERFGEPVPVGRAPYASVVNPDGSKTTGVARMSTILQNLRNRGVVVLPDDKTQRGNDVDYDYQIEYLESQMRGADFERYLMRLDEEISLALFTPLLILRTADVGSYNLGTTHWNVFMQMLNALSGDWAEYINRYILAPMVRYNFGSNAKPAYIVFRKLGDDKQQLVVTLLQALISSGKAMPDIEQLGEIAGLTVEEVREATSEEDPDERPEDAPPADSGGTDSTGDSTQASRGAAKAVIAKMASRALAQYRTARREGSEFLKADFGHRRQIETALGRPLEREISIASAWLSDVYSVDNTEAAAGLEPLLEKLFLGDA